MPERYSYPRTARIRQKHEFSRVFSQGRKVWGSRFIAYFLVDADSETRLGLVVSRKVGKAVVRNRVKRLIREFFRSNRSRFPQGMQLVVIARASCVVLDGPACIAELESMFGQWLRDA